jgi:serine/threonine protein kinase
MKPGDPVPAGHLLDGRYRVNRVIGRGGMGRVYMANDTRLANRPVAVKEMMVGAGEQEKKAIEDFQREANVLAGLSHPGIPNLFDNFIERGRHYLVMEFVAGGDLQGMLDQLGPGARIPEPKVLRWARQILDVLGFLHSQNPPIIYRDFKPGNIMIDRNGRAMLIDFGIARFLPPGGRGTQIGSVGYAPPEQYMGKAEPRSDLYSLAATLHHLLTGRDPQLEPPFSFPPVRQLAPQVSLQTARVVMSALEREVDKRPASAREMLDALPVPPEAGEDAPAAAAASPHASPRISVIPTIVLSQPAQVAAPPASAASSKPQQPSGLQKLARSATPRRLKLPPAQVAPGSATGSVSSTAKTQDLKRKKGGAAFASDAPAQGATGGASATTVQPQSGSTRQPDQGATHQARPEALRSGTVATADPSVSAARSGAPPPGSRTPVHPAAEQGNGRVRSQVATRSDGPWLVSRIERAEFAMVGHRAVIGRRAAAADGNDIDIDLSTLKRGAERVSRRHAEIVKLGRDYFIRDLGSLNGTYISGRGRLGRDQLYKLNDRDEVLIGSARLEFRRSRPEKGR